jgi:linoleoyl-CoA desaturase
MGFFKDNYEFRKELLLLIAWKLAYYSYALVLPIIMLPLSPWIVITAFMSMHLVTGLLISTIFQVAHIMPATEFPLPDEKGEMEDDWYRHQLATTTNFAPGSRLFSWLIGGLNHQIEHHLLPGVCHIHYRNISGIVADTVREFGMPYNIKKTFASAIWDHVKMLYQLGKSEPLGILKSR